jgi:hypothetical protein
MADGTITKQEHEWRMTTLNEEWETLMDRDSHEARDFEMKIGFYAPE